MEDDAPTTPDAPVAVKVLGPIELWVGDRPVGLGGSRTKALVARLLMDNNQVVPVDVLVESLWPDAANDRLEVTLRSLVSRLRQRLRTSGVDDGLIVTRQNGYMLTAETELVDAMEFERHLAAGRSSLSASDPARSAEALRAGLALWRGPAMGEVRLEPFAQVEARRLEELRLNAIGSRIEAELQLGMHRDVLEELEELARSHWTREHFWCQWMLALYRSDRRDDALGAYDELRATLVREMGVDPGLEATRLVEEIRAGGQSLSWQAPVPQRDHTIEDHAIPLPAPCAHVPRGGFFGRAHERDQLREALDAVSAEGSQRILFIGGEPGIGKTSLSMELARHAHAAGAIVLFGAADEEFNAPYAPWRDSLAHLIGHAPRHLLDQLSPHAGPLVQMVPAIADVLGTPAPSISIDPEAARYVWFGAVKALLRTAGDLAPVVLILDDLQWADAPSLHLLRHVVAPENATPLLVIGVHRTFGVGAIHPLAKLLGDARRWPDTQRMELLGITHQELQQMMEHAAGRRLKGRGLILRDTLLAETDGNPFFLSELLQHLIDLNADAPGAGDWLTSAEFTTRELPVTVREVIGQRVARLGDPVRQTLTAAAAIGRHFDFRLLASVSDLDENELLDVLDTAIEAALVVNTGTFRYSFSHALVEHAVYDMLAPTRRARLHRRIAEAIEGDPHQPPAQKAIVLAHHWAETSDADSSEKAIEFARAAGDQALRLLAPDEALRWYTRVISLLEQSPSDDPLLRCQLNVGIGQAQRQAGDPAYRETLIGAAQTAKRLGATDLLVAAVLANSRGFASTVGKMDHERVALLEAACESVEERVSPERALLTSLLALELTYDDGFERRKELADRALALSRAVGDPATRCGVINNIRQAIEVPDTLDQRLSLTAEAFETARGIGDPVLLCLCALNRSFTAFQASDVVAGNEALAVAREVADALGKPTLRWWVTTYELDRICTTGDLERAEELTNAAYEMGLVSGQHDAALFFSSQIGALRLMQGRTGEIVDFIPRNPPDRPALSTYSMFLAMVYCDLDRPGDARALLEPFVATGFASVPYGIFWLPSLSVASYAVAHLGWVEAAGPLYAALTPYPDQFPYLGSIRWCQVRYSLGLLASTLGLDDAADVHFALALENHARMGTRWSLAMTQLSWGEVLAGRNDAAARATAAELLRHALGSALAQGYGQIARRAELAMATHGFTEPEPGVTKRSHLG